MSRKRSRRESVLLVFRVVLYSAVLLTAAFVECRVRRALDDPAALAPLEAPQPAAESAERARPPR